MAGSVETAVGEAGVEGQDVFCLRGGGREGYPLVLGLLPFLLDGERGLRHLSFAPLGAFWLRGLC